MSVALHREVAQKLIGARSPGELLGIGTALVAGYVEGAEGRSLQVVVEHADRRIADYVDRPGHRERRHRCAAGQRLDVTGTLPLGNALEGIEVDGPNNLIGGTKPAARNIISANRFGVALLAGTSQNNRIEGNYIGTNSAGTAAIATRVAW